MNNLCCQKLELGPISTNAFLLWEDHVKEAVLIDCPPFGGNEVKELLSQKNLKLKEIWLTHGHWDHIAGVREFSQFKGKVIGHPSDQILFEKPELMSSFSLPELVLEPVHITDWVEDGSTLDLWERSVSVLHCPGHCPGNIAFYLESENICFVGDVIFSGSVGRTDLPGGDFEDLKNSILNKIYTLPDHTELAVGHGPNTTVGQEKASNPYVRP
jgi:hydroxyacylglutathione hydrolase